MEEYIYSSTIYKRVKCHNCGNINKKWNTEEYIYSSTFHINGRIFNILPHSKLVQVYIYSSMFHICGRIYIFFHSLQKCKTSLLRKYGKWNV